MEIERLDTGIPATTRAQDRIRVAAGIAGAVMIVLAGVVLLAQIQVTHAETGVTRSCGSAFDSIADRSGWELWWARDLDEPEGVRDHLVRTTQCPDAVNLRLGIAAALGLAGLGLGAFAMRRRRPDRAEMPATSLVGRRVARIGRFTSALGGTLTAGGVVAIALLVADSDSTLFLYTDRLVVAVVGLIVLIPTITLFVIGRVLVLVGDSVRQSEEESHDD
jgi:hypothetical protein